MTKINPSRVGYLADITKDYCTKLDKVTGWADLHKLTKDYYSFAWDAWADAQRIQTNKAWLTFKKFMEEERKEIGHTDAEYEQWSSILLPAPMMAIEMVASHFKVPFGVAFIRLREEKMLTVDDRQRVIPHTLPEPYIRRYIKDTP